MRAKLVLLLLILTLSIPTVVHSQSASDAEPYVWTTGLLDSASNSVYYSIFVYGGDQGLSKLTITGHLPDQAALVAASWKPETATYVGEAGGTLTWTLKSLPAKMLTGPFTFQVSFADASARPPAQINASVEASDGSAVAQVSDNVLAPLADSGSLEITPQEMTDFVPVEKTGIAVQVKADAVAEPVKLTFRRIPITSDLKLPATLANYWWCSIVSITAAQNTVVSAIRIAIPLRRATTPGLIMPIFAQNPDASWTLISPQSTLEERINSQFGNYAWVSAEGSTAYIQLRAVTFGPAPLTLAVGVQIVSRTRSTSPVFNAALIKNGNINLPVGVKTSDSY